MIKNITKHITYNILQNTKRLRTQQKPQENQIIPIDKNIFEDAVLLQLIRLKDAFQKLAQTTTKDPLQITLLALCRLQVSNSSGTFILQGNSDLSTLFLTSPISGTYKYYYDHNQKRFYSNKDGHLLDENLSRQAQRHFGDILLL